ncbi:MAG: succinate dehydrogenase assembly factor 2 [Gammaproteobacteria bacterium]|nr:succinate dehydrogenase assembly factor 2 [Gammaproteobacteria bacterium]
MDNRIKWACRRGMLELDLILEAYLEKRYPSAPPAEKELFVHFLTESDQDIFDWLFKKNRPENPESQKMIDILLCND